MAQLETRMDDADINAPLIDMSKIGSQADQIDRDELQSDTETELVSVGSVAPKSSDEANDTDKPSTETQAEID